MSSDRQLRSQTQRKRLKQEEDESAGFDSSSVPDDVWLLILDFLLNSADQTLMNLQLTCSWMRKLVLFKFKLLDGIQIYYKSSCDRYDFSKWYHSRQLIAYFCMDKGESKFWRFLELANQLFPQAKQIKVRFSAVCKSVELFTAIGETFSPRLTVITLAGSVSETFPFRNLLQLQTNLKKVSFSRMLNNDWISLLPRTLQELETFSSLTANDVLHLKLCTKLTNLKISSMSRIINSSD